jgi:hypothetical protein
LEQWLFEQARLRKPWRFRSIVPSSHVPARKPTPSCALHTGLWWSRQHHGLAISALLGVDFALSLSIVLATAIG